MSSVHHPSRLHHCDGALILFTEIVEGGDAFGGVAGFIGEDVGLWAEEMAGGELEGVALVSGIRCVENAAAGSFEQGEVTEGDMSGPEPGD